MSNHEFLFGPVLSRRLGISLGICPIPYSHCNYSCIYCYLGKTQNLTNTRAHYFPVDTILNELEAFLNLNPELDVISIVGDGEPTLYSELGDLIKGIRSMTELPVAVITNGALLSNPTVRAELLEADLVLPSLDAFDEISFKTINRPHGSLLFKEMVRGLQEFSKQFEGYLWLETMLIEGINDDELSLYKLKTLFDTINYQKLYINIPIRTTAEKNVNIPSYKALENAFQILKGFTLELLPKELLHYEIKDHLQALKETLRIYPLNELEVKTLLRSRKCENTQTVLDSIKSEPDIEVKYYKRFHSYHLKTF